MALPIDSINGSSSQTSSLSAAGLFGLGDTTTSKSLSSSASTLFDIAGNTTYIGDVGFEAAFNGLNGIGFADASGGAISDIPLDGANVSTGNGATDVNSSVYADESGNYASFTAETGDTFYSDDAPAGTEMAGVYGGFSSDMTSPQVMAASEGGTATGDWSSVTQAGGTISAYSAADAVPGPATTALPAGVTMATANPAAMQGTGAQGLSEAAIGAALNNMGAGAGAANGTDAATRAMFNPNTLAAFLIAPGAPGENNYFSQLAASQGKPASRKTPGDMSEESPNDIGALAGMMQAWGGVMQAFTREVPITRPPTDDDKVKDPSGVVEITKVFGSGANEGAAG
jgi:hypothetical protein